MSPTAILTALALPPLLGLAWHWHVTRHPWMNCTRCDGSAKRRTGWLADRFGTCTKCGGSGRRLRLSAKLLRIDIATGKRAGR